jgi:hypothetical protein
MQRNQRIIKNRKKLWDLFGWGYQNQDNRLLKNHSLNCGCSQCRARTYFNRKERRDDRHKIKLLLKNS